MRIIDADELKNRIQKTKTMAELEDTAVLQGAVIRQNEIYDIIETMPTIECKDNTYFIMSMSVYLKLWWWECAECGYVDISNYKFATKPAYNYCPRCGRKITDFRDR